MNPELAAKVELWRQKIAEGTLTKEEQVEAVKYLRAGRISSIQSAPAKRAKAIKAIPNAEDLLSDMEG